MDQELSSDFQNIKNPVSAPTPVFEYASRRESQHLIDLIRVRSYEKQKRARELWALTQEELDNYMASYPLIDKVGYTLKELGDSQNLRLIRSEHRIYFGQIFQRQKHGRGICIYSDGRVFEGHFDSNQKSGPGFEVYPNANVYVGEYDKNRKHGLGTFYWFTLASKQFTEYYSGEWWAGLPSGRGIHQRANGDCYEGQFRNGLKHGEGMERFTNGDTYVGEFVNGLPEGYGQYNWSDGSSYKGDFKQGMRNGFGIWKKDNSLQNCESYRGNYLLDKKSGYGVYVWVNGEYYKGEFFDDKKHGYGEFGNARKVIYQGMWENGERAEHLNATRREAAARTVQLSGGGQRSALMPSTLIRDMSEGCIKRTPVINSSFRQTTLVSARSHRSIGATTQRKNLQVPEEQYHNHHHHHQTVQKDTPNYMRPLNRRCGHKDCVPNREYGHMPIRTASKSRGKN